MGPSRDLSVLLNPFCAFSTAKVIALKATLLLLLTRPPAKAQLAPRQATAQARMASSPPLLAR